MVFFQPSGSQIPQTAAFSHSILKFNKSCADLSWPSAWSTPWSLLRVNTFDHFNAHQTGLELGLALQVAMEKNHKSCNLDRFMNLLQGVHTVVNIIKIKNLLLALLCTFLAVLLSVSDPHSNWAWIRIRIRNPDPDPRSRCLKIGWKKPKFTVTDFKDENRKMLWLSWNFNHSFLSLFQELITLGNSLLSRTVKKLSHRMKIFCWLGYYIKLSHYKSTKTRMKSDFLPMKTKNYISLNMRRPGSRIRIHLEILGWIRITRMRIRNTGVEDPDHFDAMRSE
jgi:hypothetical protein